MIPEGQRSGWSYRYLEKVKTMQWQYPYGGLSLKKLQRLFLCLGMIVFSGCLGTQVKDDPAAVSGLEPEWVRDGHPIEFEGEFWYPVDNVENFMDTEVYSVGNFEDTEFFVDRVDVRPYDHVYTKFGRNQYRMFEKGKSRNTAYLKGRQHD